MKTKVKVEFLAAWCRAVVFGVSFALLFSGCKPPPAPASSPAVAARWQYQTVRVENSTHAARGGSAVSRDIEAGMSGLIQPEVALHQMDEWELVAAVPELETVLAKDWSGGHYPNTRTGAVLLIFKRRSP